MLPTRYSKAVSATIKDVEALTKIPSHYIQRHVSVLMEHTDDTYNIGSEVMMCDGVMGDYKLIRVCRDHAHGMTKGKYTACTINEYGAGDYSEAHHDTKSNESIVVYTFYNNKEYVPQVYRITTKQGELVRDEYTQHGDAIIMSPEFNDKYKHEMLPFKDRESKRVSIVFRTAETQRPSSPSRDLHHLLGDLHHLLGDFHRLLGGFYVTVSQTVDATRDCGISMYRDITIHTLNYLLPLEQTEE
jgi:hypothetical protein